MPANVQLYACAVVESSTAAGLETAINGELAAIQALNVGPNGQALGGNLISVQYGTTITTADVINLTCVIVYSYYGPSA